MLPGRACDEFMQGLQQLEVDADRVPDFERLTTSCWLPPAGALWRCRA
jgi:phenylalanine-4-hydroxylase